MVLTLRAAIVFSVMLAAAPVRGAEPTPEAAPSLIPATPRLDAIQMGRDPAAVAAVVRQAATLVRKGAAPDLRTALSGTPEDDARRAALDTLALQEALRREASYAAVLELVASAVAFRGALAGEAARHVQALGERAVAPLWEQSRNGGRAARGWAGSQLEALGKRLPSDALQTRDDEVLFGVLHAFGVTKDMDALPAVLSFVAAERPVVRKAARDAIDLYGADALFKLREAYTNLTNKAAPEDWSAGQVAAALYRAYDSIRMQEAQALLDEGLSAFHAGQVDQSVALFDKVLARYPDFDGRSAMVPAYVAYAEARLETDRGAARGAYEKAALMGPEPHRTSAIAASLAYLDGMDLLVRGIEDPAPFRRALDIDPTHGRATAELARLEARSAERQERVRPWIWGSAAAALGVTALLVAVGSWLFRRRRSPALRPRTR